MNTAILTLLYQNGCKGRKRVLDVEGGRWRLEGANYNVRIGWDDGYLKEFGVIKVKCKVQTSKQWGADLLKVDMINIEKSTNTLYACDIYWQDAR